VFFKLSEKQPVVLSKQPIVLLLGVFEKVENYTDRSSDLGVDQSQGGAPKAGSTGKFSRTGRSPVRLMGKGAVEGPTSRQGVEASGLGTPTVKMDKKGGFQATSQLPVGRGPNHEGSMHGVLGIR